eukprot:403356681
MSNDDYDQLGYYSLALLYLTLGFGCLIATAIMGKIGVKKSLMLGSFCDTLWILCNLPPALKDENTGSDSFFYSDGFIYFTQLFAAVLDGFGDAVQWVAQGKYISDCATEKTKGFYFSYFWTYYMSSQVFGNLIAAFVLGNFKQSYFFLIMAAFSSTSILIFATLRKPVLQARIKAADPNGNAQSDVQLNQNTSNEFQDDGDNYDSLPFWQEVKAIIDLMFSKKMMILLPQVFWTGISLAVYTGLLVPIITDTIPGDDDNDKFMKSMFAMVALGVGEMVGGLFIGQIIDRYGNRKAAVANVVLILIQTGITITYIVIYEYSWLAFLMTFAWGFADSANCTHTSEMLGFEFDNNSQPYSIDNLGQAIGAFTFEIIEAFITGKSMYLVFNCVVGGIGVLFNITTMFFKFKPMYHEVVNDGSMLLRGTDVRLRKGSFLGGSQQSFIKGGKSTKSIDNSVITNDQGAKLIE